jgi:hypothetical protein
MPALSVLTPIYNGEAFVERCYATLKAQTFGDWAGSPSTTARATPRLHRAES